MRPIVILNLRVVGPGEPDEPSIWKSTILPEVSISLLPGEKPDEKYSQPEGLPNHGIPSLCALQYAVQVELGLDIHAIQVHYIHRQRLETR
jgi:hypothetical protein